MKTACIVLAALIGIAAAGTAVAETCPLRPTAKIHLGSDEPNAAIWRALTDHYTELHALAFQKAGRYEPTEDDAFLEAFRQR